MATGTALRTTGHAAKSSSTNDDQKLDASDWLLCRAGSRAFALPISEIVEASRALPIEQLVDAPPLVRGLCIIRGAPVVVLDTGVLFGDRALDYQRIVTVRVGHRTIGFLAESVIGIRTIPADALPQLPALLSEIETISAITRLDDELVFLLRAARAVPEDFLASIDKRELQT